MYTMFTYRSVSSTPNYSSCTSHYTGGCYRLYMHTSSDM